MAFLLNLGVFLSLVSLPLASAILIISWNPLRSWLNSVFKNMPYPPGPPAQNFLSGNSGDVPTNDPWVTYAQWGNLYGDIVHFRLYGQHTVILNSIEAVTELLDKRSSIYSSRPHIEMVDLMGWGFNAGLKPYGPEWRRHRRLFQQTFRPAVSPNFRPVVAKKINDMLYNLLVTPEEFVNHYKTVAAAIIMTIVYGYDIAPTQDYFVSLSEAAAGQLSASFFPGAVVVNALPILRHIPEWFPGAGFQRFARETRKLTTQMQEVPLEYVKKEMAAGTASPSVASELLTKFTSKEDYEVIKVVCATSYAGGSDTTASALGTFFYAMATHPEIQKKAQQEIDDVVGLQRLVTLDDRESLPYVEALCRELVRWRPVLPLGVPHSSLRDDVYKGYYIPEAQAISHDDQKFEDPDELNPDRQLDGQGNLNSDYEVYLFGFGRRICPGRHTAADSYWLSVASIISTFDIRLKKDAAGNDIPIKPEYTPALISHLHPFECSVTPRSKASEHIIRQAVGKIA